MHGVGSATIWFYMHICSILWFELSVSGTACTCEFSARRLFKFNSGHFDKLTTCQIAVGLDLAMMEACDSWYRPLCEKNATVDAASVGGPRPGKAKEKNIYIYIHTYIHIYIYAS